MVVFVHGFLNASQSILMHISIIVIVSVGLHACINSLCEPIIGVHSLQVISRKNLLHSVRILNQLKICVIFIASRNWNLIWIKCLRWREFISINGHESNGCHMEIGILHSSIKGQTFTNFITTLLVFWMTLDYGGLNLGTLVMFS